jgi:hypothetical protein
MRCFLNQEPCNANCMAWCGDENKPSCVIVEGVAMMGAVSAHALGQASKPITKHPPSAPPPEVKS